MSHQIRLELRTDRPEDFLLVDRTTGTVWRASRVNASEPNRWIWRVADGPTTERARTAVE